MNKLTLRVKKEDKLPIEIFGK